MRYSQFGVQDLYFSMDNIDFNNADLRYSDFSEIDYFDANSITFIGANLYGATLPTGYDQAWFESEGAIFVVPEPSTYALILGGLALGFVALRRK